MKKLVCVLTIGVVATGMLPAMAAKQDGGDDGDLVLLKQTGRAFTRVAKQAVPAVVFITVEKTVETQQPNVRYNDPFGFFGLPRPRQPRQQLLRGQGSGFIITKDGYILTNNHVVGDADRITVKLNDGRELEAERIGTDPKSEVAVIKVDTDEDLPVLETGDSSSLEIGEWVIAVGNPFGLSETLTVGVVSAIGRNDIGIAEYEDFIQTDAAINPGNSGGPLLNIDGEVVGINTAIYSQSGGYMGIGFAIPIDLAIVIKDQLVAFGKVTRGFLGVQLNPHEMDEAMAESFELDEAGGVLVAEVVPDSPADDAGLEAGDIILEMNGETVEGNRTFRNRVALTEPGKEIKLKVFSDGDIKTLKVTIGTLPGDEAVQQQAVEVAEKLGLSVRELTPELAEKFGHEMGEGVMVAGVEPYSAAAQAEMQPGHLILSVNRKPVTTIKEFSEALAEVAERGRVLLRVKSHRYSWYALLRFE
ncbi:MAG: DegQ family serine endoprotease [Kiritimatiellae bacterium]|nr:DegQ family serine endoprotease [Kiritimatiellia bacterium]